VNEGRHRARIDEQEQIILPAHETDHDADVLAVRRAGLVLFETLGCRTRRG
jgi:hypothetical protein